MAVSTVFFLYLYRLSIARGREIYSHSKNQLVAATGQWKERRWTVVMQRKLSVDSPDQGISFRSGGIDNPLGTYPNRGWEKIYLDQYRYDDSFTWICAPNEIQIRRPRQR